MYGRSSDSSLKNMYLVGDVRLQPSEPTFVARKICNQIFSGALPLVHHFYESRIEKMWLHQVADLKKLVFSPTKLDQMDF